jgi:hypothetical protein
MEGKTIYSYIQVLFELTHLSEFHFISLTLYEFKVVYFPFSEPLLQVTWSASWLSVSYGTSMLANLNSHSNIFYNA